MKRAIVLIASVLLLSGCKTKERVVTVEHVRTDTTYITRHQRDSIYVQDSTFVRERTAGDTVWVEVTRWNRVVKDRTRVDTVYRSRVDSVPVPYPVCINVPAELTKWQRFRMGLGSAVLCGMLTVIIISLIRIIRKQWT